jgi:hypothetical protein
MMSTLSFLCDQGAANGGAGNNGLALAVVALGIIVVLALLPRTGASATSSSTSAHAKPGAKGSEVATQASNAEGAITPELVAVLTAAATVALGRNVRIREISAGKMAAQRAWSQEGRREIYLSHRIR